MPVAPSRSLPASPPKFEPRQLLLLSAITAVAAAMRLLQLGEWSFWVDEAHSYRDATLPLAELAREDRIFYAAPFLLLRALLDGGTGAHDVFTLRLPFALAGTLTVPLVAFCGRRLVGRGPALLAAALLALDPWHVFWSQNARGYALMLPLALLAVERFAAWLVSERNGDLFAAVGSLGLSAFAHPTAALLAPAWLACLAVQRDVARGTARARRSLLVLVLLLLATPWLVRLTPFQDFLVSKNDPSLLHFVQTSLFYFRPAVLLVAVAGVVLAARTLAVERFVLLVSCLVVPFAVLSVVGGGIAKVTARYALCTLPLWHLFAGVAVVAVAGAVGERRARARAWALAALLLVVPFADRLTQLVDYHGPWHGARARWHEALQLVQQRAGEAPLRVLTVNEPTARYYLRPDHWRAAGIDPHPTVSVWPLIGWMFRNGIDEQLRPVHPPGAVAHLDWHLEQARRSGATFAVLFTLPELLEQDPGRELLGAIERRFELAHYLPCWVGPKDESVHVYVHVQQR